MDPDLARIVAWGSLGFTALMLVVAFFGLRKERPIRLGRDLLSLLFSVGAIAVFAILTPVVTRAQIAVGAAVLGLSLGLRRGLQLDVRIDGAKALARHGRAALLTWGVGVLVTQAAAATVRSGILRLGQGLSILGVASALGFMLGRTIPIRRARKGVPTVATASLSLLGVLGGVLALTGVAAGAGVTQQVRPAHAAEADDDGPAMQDFTWTVDLALPEEDLWANTDYLAAEFGSRTEFTVDEDGRIEGTSQGAILWIADSADTCSGFLCDDDHVDHTDRITIDGDGEGFVTGTVSLDADGAATFTLQGTTTSGGVTSSLQPGEGHVEDGFTEAILQAFEEAMRQVLVPSRLELPLVPGTHDVEVVTLVGGEEFPVPLRATIGQVPRGAEPPPPPAVVPSRPADGDLDAQEPTDEPSDVDGDGDIDEDAAIAQIDQELISWLAAGGVETADLDPQDAATAAAAAALAAALASAIAMGGSSAAAVDAMAQGAGHGGPGRSGTSIPPRPGDPPPKPTGRPPGATAPGTTALLDPPDLEPEPPPDPNQLVSTWDPNRDGPGQGGFRQVPRRQRDGWEALTRQSNREARLARDAALLQEIRADRARLEAIEAAQRQERERILAGARREAAHQDGDFRRSVHELTESGDIDGLYDLWRPAFDDRMDAIRAEHQQALDEAAWARRGELAARGVQNAARAGLMLGGGPLGSTLGNGLISAAEDTEASRLRGESWSQMAQHGSVGFVSGAKDAALARLGSAPGVGVGTRVATGMLTDSAEAYGRARMLGASHEQAMDAAETAAAMSAAGELLSTGADRFIPPGGVRNAVRLGSDAGLGAGGAWATGGDPVDGALDALAGSMGSAAGGRGVTATGKLRDGHQVLADAVAERQGTPKPEVPLDQQGRPVQDLVASAHLDKPPPDVDFDVETGPDGSVRIVERERAAEGGLTGSGQREYGDPKHGLETYADTQAGRTAKQADPRTQRIIENTRHDLINKPADQATIRTVAPELARSGLLQPGDRVEIDTFNTPTARQDGGDGGWELPTMSKPRPPGADRDARMVIRRPRADGSVETIEVPRSMWEREAYSQWSQRAESILTEGGTKPLPPDVTAAVQRQVSEISHLSGPPDNWTPQQIRDRAMAEVHNQLFTDRHHMEASLDNSDQLVAHRTVFGGTDDDQLPNVVRSQTAGTSPTGQAAQLGDPSGYASMWQNKTDFYAHNPPEALAQAQKGIDQYVRLREGYEANGMTPPPIDQRVANAMATVLRAPTGVDATPDRMDAVLGQLRQDLGKPDLQMKDALGLIGLQQEGLKWSAPPGAPTAPTGQWGDRSAAIEDTIRSAAEQAAEAEEER